MADPALLTEIGRVVSRVGGEAYFVGGCVRDALRGEPIKDVDFAVAGSPYETARAVADTFGGPVFWLRQEDGVARVILRKQGGLQLDFTPLRGSLEEDLKARDLTINAMAVPAVLGLDAAAIADPLGGRADLAGRLVRFVSPEAPEQDPLRTMRALRFRWKLDFTIEERTAVRVRECVPLLERVSTERVRDELFQLLAIASAAEALAECLDYGMARWLFGREPGGEPSAPAASLEKMLGILQNAPPELCALLQRETTEPRRRREILLWAAALQPVSPPVKPGTAARYLALSSQEGQLIVKGLTAAPAARELAGRWPPPGRDLYRLSRKASTAAPEAVLLAAALDGWSPAYAEMLADQLDRHLRPEEPLLTGEDAMQILNIGPGPRIGQVLEEVQEARADGLLRTREEAAEWLRERARGEASQA